MCGACAGCVTRQELGIPYDNNVWINRVGGPWRMAPEPFGGFVRVLGIVSETHDTGLALVRDGVPELVLEEERFSRIKRTRAFPTQSLQAAFDDRGLSLNDIDAIALPWNSRALRAFVARALIRRFPASLNLMHARAASS
jgi:Carbamoyltransferase N-terminus